MLSRQSRLEKGEGERERARVWRPEGDTLKLWTLLLRLLRPPEMPIAMQCKRQEQKKRASLQLLNHESQPSTRITIVTADAPRPRAIVMSVSQQIQVLLVKE